MIRVFDFWGRLAPERKLYFVVGTMAVLIATELVVLKLAMTQLSAVRAFVEGEALWSKSQKNALLDLKQYSLTADETNYQSFLKNLEVPAGDHIARLELAKSEPNMSTVRSGFLQGHIHPDDIDPMVSLLLRFHRISYVSQAIDYWGKGDELISSVRDVADRLHVAVKNTDRVTARALMDQIDGLNDQLTDIEERFSRVLSDGSRWLEGSVLSILFVMVILVESTGLTLALVTGRQISGLAAENKRLYEEAKKSLMMRDEFLSVASHELKTPLTALVLQLQMLHETAEKMASGPEVKDVLSLSEGSLASTKRLRSLLEELLDLTRIRIGHFEIHKERCDLTAIVKEAVAQLTIEANDRGSTVTLEMANAILGHFDRSRINQIVVNLLSNAIKYGEGKPIRIRIENAGTLARIIVQDSGRGIAEDQLPKLFQRFERLEQDSAPGLGLGLYISSEIVKAHGGTIRAESHQGKGSTFIVELPIE